VLGDEEVAELIVDLLPPGGRVLDVGCGGGHTLRALARRGVEGMGVDPHPYGRAPCRHLHAEEISTLEERFDLVYTLHALHEFDAPERFPREAKQILRPGGILLVMDRVRCPAAGGAWADDDPGRPAADSQRGYEAVLKDNIRRLSS